MPKTSSRGNFINSNFSSSRCDEASATMKVSSYSHHTTVRIDLMGCFLFHVVVASSTFNECVSGFVRPSVCVFVGRIEAAVFEDIVMGICVCGNSLRFELVECGLKSGRDQIRKLPTFSFLQMSHLMFCG